MKLILPLLLWCVVAGGATLNSPTANGPDVQATLNLATDLDIVKVPPGIATWTTKVTSSHAVTLVGSGIGITVISNGVVGDAALSISSSGGPNVLGFSWYDTNVLAAPKGTVMLTGVGYRVATNSFQGSGSSLMINPVAWNLDSQGVIDHDNFGPTSGSEINMFGNTNNWNFGTTFGTTNANYVETCVFSFLPCAPFVFGDGAIDTYNGAKVVFRNNMVTNTYFGYHGCDSGGFRSTHSAEVYGNIFVWCAPGGSGLDTVIQSRGGCTLAWGNWPIGGPWNSIVKKQCFRFGGAGSTCALTLGNCPPWGSMTGANIFDGNSDGTGYPGLDQVGRTGPTTFGVTHSTQVLSPDYVWGNTNVATVFGYIVADPNIQLNRDYFTTPAPGYTPLVYPHPLVSKAANSIHLARVTNLHAGKTKVGP